MFSSNYDRAAELHYAFQFGQDYRHSGNIAVKEEFEQKFCNDEEAKAEFAKGEDHISYLR